MFVKNVLNGLSSSLDIKYKSLLRPGMNSADKGEICELFVKEFLSRFLDDHYRVFRGGNIINLFNEQSPQIDIVLTNRNTLPIFDDKGLYPIETIIGVFSVTSNLTKSKLISDISHLSRIPKRGYYFHMEKYFSREFVEATQRVWLNLIPFSCIFAFEGNLNEGWLDDLNKNLEQATDKSLCPSVVLVNKQGMFEKVIAKSETGSLLQFYKYTKLDDELQGYAFSKILNDLYNLSGEQSFRRPDYAHYFNSDYE